MSSRPPRALKREPSSSLASAATSCSPSLRNTASALLPPHALRQRPSPSIKPASGSTGPGQPSIDEGWTRWILEKYGFAPESLYNAGVKAGNLRARFDTIILPDMSKTPAHRRIQTGMVPSEYAGGIDTAGADALRQFVREGGTLIAFNQSSSTVIDLFGLPVTNILADVKSDQFFCSGALLRGRVEKFLPSQPLWIARRSHCHVRARTGLCT